MALLNTPSIDFNRLYLGEVEVCMVANRTIGKAIFSVIASSEDEARSLLLMRAKSELPPDEWVGHKVTQLHKATKDDFDFG